MNVDAPNVNFENMFKNTPQRTETKKAERFFL